MTNGDRIRQMTNEELQCLLYTVRFGGWGDGNEVIKALEESRLREWLASKRTPKKGKNNVQKPD